MVWERETGQRRGAQEMQRAHRVRDGERDGSMGLRRESEVRDKGQKERRQMEVEEREEEALG